MSLAPHDPFWGQTMMKKFVASLVFATALIGSSLPASADLIQVNFTVGPFDEVVGAAPFGINPASLFSGHVVFDTTKTGAAAFHDVSWTTGTKTWAENDLLGGLNSVTFAGGLVTSFFMDFGLSNFVIFNKAPFGTRFASLADGDLNGRAACLSDCVSITQGPVAVPGPLVGAGMPGFVLAGAGMLAWWRRRRPSPKRQ